MSPLSEELAGLEPLDAEARSVRRQKPGRTPVAGAGPASSVTQAWRYPAIAATAVTEIIAAIKLYSIAPAPESSQRSSLRILNICLTSVGNVDCLRGEMKIPQAGEQMKSILVKKWFELIIKNNFIWSFAEN